MANIQSVTNELGQELHAKDVGCEFTEGDLVQLLTEDENNHLDNYSIISLDSSDVEERHQIIMDAVLVEEIEKDPFKNDYKTEGKGNYPIFGPFIKKTGIRSSECRSIGTSSAASVPHPAGPSGSPLIASSTAPAIVGPTEPQSAGVILKNSECVSEYEIHRIMHFSKNFKNSIDRMSGLKVASKRQAALIKKEESEHERKRMRVEEMKRELDSNERQLLRLRNEMIDQMRDTMKAWMK